MSEFKPEEPINAEQSERPSAPHTKQKKSHPVLTITLAALVGLGTGFTGAMVALKTYSPSNTVVYTSSQDSGTAKQTSATDGLTTAEVAEKASASVVEINVKGTVSQYGFFGGTYETNSAGSGVIISQDGYIITNNHVVEDGTEFNVVTSDGTSYEATLIGTDANSDIAVLKVEAEGLTPATIGDSDKLAVGDTAVVIGNPLGTLGGTVTDGIISATNRELTINNRSMNLIQTNAAINSGNSGGGLFDSNANLVGIVNAKDSGTTSSGTTIEGLGFAIPINDAMNVAKQLIENGKVTDRATLGVYVSQLDQSTSRYEAGLYVTDVVTGGPAEQAGLKAYDRFVSIDGTDITSYSDLTSVLNKKKAGDEVEVVVERKGEQLTFDVTLTDSSNA